MSDKKSFSDLVKEVFPDVKFINKGVCPDQFVGIIRDLRNNEFSRKPVKERPVGVKCLILILESPHKKEFEGKKGPAKGATGTQILKHILDVEGLEEYADYGLILVNAIWYQCSLGFATRLYRNRIFSHVWNNCGKGLFIKRLKDVGYFYPRDVIVNCCTRGGANRFDQRVGEAINEAFPDAKLLHRYHPYSWFNKNNRRAL